MKKCEHRELLYIYIPVGGRHPIVSCYYCLSNHILPMNWFIPEVALIEIR